MIFLESIKGINILTLRDSCLLSTLPLCIEMNVFSPFFYSKSVFDLVNNEKGTKNCLTLASVTI